MLEHRKGFFYVTRSDRYILKWINLGRSESILNFIAVFEHAGSSVFSFNFLTFISIYPFSLSLSLSLALSLSLSPFISFIREKSIKCTIMQINVIYELKPEKWHNMQYKSLNIMLLNLKILKICIKHEFAPQKAKICKHAREKYHYLELL